MPDLSGYTTVSTYPFVMGNEVYFQTPDGLLCAIQPDRGAAGCDGRLPGTPDEVNEIALSARRQHPRPAAPPPTTAS